ncbi:hypothetical protein D1P53_001700 [Cryptococcus gattii VGV]|nr:hypothetical protein D1P53_001700 [Cryptococcus gattii VGV]
MLSPGILKTVHDFLGNVFPTGRSREASSGSHTPSTSSTPLCSDPQSQSTVRGLSSHYTQPMSRSSSHSGSTSGIMGHANFNSWDAKMNAQHKAASDGCQATWKKGDKKKGTTQHPFSGLRKGGKGVEKHGSSSKGPIKVIFYWRIRALDVRKRKRRRGGKTTVTHKKISPVNLILGMDFELLEATEHVNYAFSDLFDHFKNNHWSSPMNQTPFCIDFIHFDDIKEDTIQLRHPEGQKWVHIPLSKISHHMNMLAFWESECIGGKYNNPARMKERVLEPEETDEGASDDSEESEEEGGDDDGDSPEHLATYRFFNDLCHSPPASPSRFSSSTGNNHAPSPQAIHCFMDETGMSTRSLGLPAIFERDILPSSWGYNPQHMPPLVYNPPATTAAASVNPLVPIAPAPHDNAEDADDAGEAGNAGETGEAGDS